MPTTANKYCSNCLRTQKFMDLGSFLICERCNKQLLRVPNVLLASPGGGRNELSSSSPTGRFSSGPSRYSVSIKL